MTEQLPEGFVDLNAQYEWEGPANEELKIPEVYITQLKYEILVHPEKRPYIFRCSRYKKRLRGEWIFDNVVIDSSMRNPKGEITLRRLAYHPQISLVGVPFMVVPAVEKPMVLPAEEEPATP